MRLTDDAIPTTFTRLDESVVAADRFVDVRTQQQMRINHNALCGNAHMRPIFHDSYGGKPFGTPYSASAWLPSDGWPDAAERGSYTTFYHQDIYVGPFVRKLLLRVYCLPRDSDWEIYAGLFTSGAESRDLVNFTASSPTSGYTADLTMPHRTRLVSGLQRVTFWLGGTPTGLGSDLLTQPVAVTAVNSYSVQVTQASISGAGVEAGDVMYFKGAGPGYATSDVEPRVIQGILSASGGTDWELFARDTMPWTDNPPTTSLHLEVAKLGVIDMFAVGLYEYAPTGNFADMEQGL